MTDEKNRLKIEMWDIFIMFGFAVTSLMLLGGIALIIPWNDISMQVSVSVAGTINTVKEIIIPLIALIIAVTWLGFSWAILNKYFKIKLPSITYVKPLFLWFLSLACFVASLMSSDMTAFIFIIFSGAFFLSCCLTITCEKELRTKRLENELNLGD